MARTVAEIEADIAKTKEELANVRGTEAEVYARIVGYYRSVRNWNKGKREEYKERKLFVPSEKETEAHLDGISASPANQSPCGNVTAPGAFSAREKQTVRYELFTRRTCPNCPPVKEYCEAHFEGGKIFDVDGDEGLKQAQERGVLSTPTVIFYADDGAEIARAHSVSELKTAEEALLSIAKASA